MPSEAWLGGPVPGIDPWLQPAAHAFVQARADLGAAVEGLSVAQLNARPAGVASLSFHVRHTAGATDRLLTYARGAALDAAQKQAAVAEGHESDAGPEALLAVLDAAIGRALEQLRATPRDGLLEFRGVGRAQLPSNVLGLLFHAAEHASRHAGQAVTTSRIVRG